ncbi:carbohydrate ABC transporter permease [Sinorhizobium meliloti]|uniref:carbohydrate ABC transporter permease n=1 Tax=Rhizobium meliloti TaxID=382 RepID=UPI001F1702D6|nr:carbohydrate ABC transporter permease [Sinorhizobium meliloti]
MVTRRGEARLAFAVVGLSLLLILAPFIWIVGVSLKFQINILTVAFPFEPVAVNFGRVLFGKSSDFIAYASNSLIVGLSITALVLLIGAPAAYSLAWRRWSKLFSAFFLGWTLVFHMIPPITLVCPWYLLFREIGLYNTLTGLVLIHVVINLPLTIWLLMSAFENLPREHEEAAVADGCRTSTAFFVILLPLAPPGTDSSGTAVVPVLLERVLHGSQSHDEGDLHDTSSDRVVRGREPDSARTNGSRVGALDHSRPHPDVFRSAIHFRRSDRRSRKISAGKVEVVSLGSP